MLGKHGREGLGKHQVFPLGEQKKKNQYEGHPYFDKHFPTPAFDIIILPEWKSQVEG
jgi:hypothetical protein